MTSFSYAVFWLIMTVVLAVIELSTLGLITIWFAIGAAVTIIVSLFGANIWIQLFTFVIVYTVILLTVRPIAAAHFNNPIKKTNIDAIVGRKLIVKNDIDNIKGTGKVDMDGSTWLAASSIDEVAIEAGAEVRVVRVQGAKLIVEREV